ncbi:MAG: helix-turn-helix transcriptional regulator [Lentisphaeria bacterium]|nr:helix-turn-helix transcriptional regulator [Lentisphaeria bacterium]
MADFKQIFADEIRRLARKEIKIALDPMQKTIAGQRQQIVELRRLVKELEKKAAGCTAAAPEKEIAESGDEKKIARRITGKRIVAMRNKMGLSQAQFAELLGVSLSSIVNWEKDKRTPRASQKEMIANLRFMGKREIGKRLEAAGMPRKTAKRRKLVVKDQNVAEAVPAVQELPAESAEVK